MSATQDKTKLTIQLQARPFTLSNTLHYNALQKILKVINTDKQYKDLRGKEPLLRIFLRDDNEYLLNRRHKMPSLLAEFREFAELQEQMLARQRRINKLKARYLINSNKSKLSVLP